MTVYVDTSAIFALLDHRDHNHPLASQRRSWLTSPDVTMMTSNYVVVETCALLQRRLGLDAVETFREQILPVMVVHWVTERQHERALSVLLAARRRKLSLVDCVSFELMRDCGWHHAFAFDAHFGEQGFNCEIPISPAN
jgi:predicted nucleic acid-binding protein